MKQTKRKSNVFIAFFKSIWQDIKDLFKNHIFKVIGFVISYIAPVVYIVVAYMEKKPENWSIPIFVWIPAFVLLFVYWSKLRGFLAIRVAKMETENALEKGKHAGAIIICKFIEVCCTVLPFFLGYYIFKTLREMIGKTENLFLYLGITIAVGGLFMLFDTIKNVIAFDEEVIEEGLENEQNQIETQNQNNS